MRATLAFLTCAALALAFFVPNAAALDTDPGPGLPFEVSLQGLLPAKDCNQHTGIQCEYKDCHSTTDPPCRDAVCQFMFHGKCYLDLPLP